jgi:hypothetical protein
MRSARWIFLIAGLYDVLVLVPGCFPEAQFRASELPAVTHPEVYDGFYGSALVWQLASFTIASDPLRYRPLMLVSVLEKLSFLVACLARYATSRLAAGGPLLGSLIDGVWMVLFFQVWRSTRTRA